MQPTPGTTDDTTPPARPDPSLPVPGHSPAPSLPALSLTHAAAAWQGCLPPPMREGVEVEAIRAALVETLAVDAASASVAGAEDLLARQARLLDALFNAMIVKGTGRFAEPAHILLALRAQKQCRATVEALKAMKTDSESPRPRGERAG